jgi:hypothetical protein
MNKREFVVGGCAALAGAAASAHSPGTSATDGAAPARLCSQRLPDLATDMRSAAWSAYIGQRFQVQASGTATALVLREVRVQPGTQGLDQFSLAFDGGATLLRGTHRLVHATGQRVTLYLDPSAFVGDEPCAFRADFNLLA